MMITIGNNMYFCEGMLKKGYDNMENLKSIVNEVGQMNKKYELDNNGIETLFHEIEGFEIYTPLIGNFSTGKTSLINALLDKNIFKTNITPETAIPTEISYGNNCITIFKQDVLEQISLDDIKNYDFSIENASLIKAEIDSSFLKEIPDVTLVDTPGLNSGIAVHNQALKDYLPKSIAYLFVFSADDLVLKESLIDFLKELNFYKMPICIIVTKVDKVSETTLDAGITHLKEQLSTVVNDFDICISKAKGEKNVEEVKVFLLKLQSNYSTIFNNKFTPLVNVQIKNTENYLESKLKSFLLSDSELAQKEETLSKEAERCKIQLEKEKEKFSLQVEKCIQVLKNKIQSDLHLSESFLESMLLSGSDIQGKVNSIVRIATTQTIKKEFEPKLHKYLSNINSIIDIDILSDTSVKRDTLTEETDTILNETIVQNMPILSSVMGAIIGGAITSVPILAGLGSFIGPLGVILGAAAGSFINSMFKVKKEKELREIASQKINNEIIPQVIQQASECVEAELRLYIKSVEDDVMQEFEKTISLLQKSIEDVKIEKEKELQEKEKLIDEIKADLTKIKGWYFGE